LAALLALATVVCLGAAFFLSGNTQFLMPGPLASAHGAIENCNACHTNSGSDKFSWLHGLVAGDRLADSKACLTCHKMPDTAFNAHSASAEALKQSTKRLTKIAAATPAPQAARAQSIAFPTDDVVARGLYCATCHQEHQGINFNLNKITNEQCQSCHVVKFDSFDGHHPNFEKYPFKRRTGITYDHAGHFGKHFPEVTKKDPTTRIPDTCSSCHNSRKDKRIMAVAPFEQTCTSCHLDQIVGKERVSGPKGIAFLTLPGLDLQTLRKKKASIGEWPTESEAALTPFMKVMISRNERGRALIKTVSGLNLQDLSRASDAQIKAATNLVWEIKGLFYALISGKASDVLGDLNIGSGAKLSPNLVADLTASIPWDVVISAHQQWLPNLATEMADRRGTSDQEQSGWNSVTTGSRSAVDSSDQEQSAWITTTTEVAGSAPEELPSSDARIDAYGRLIKGRGDEGEATAQPKEAAGKAVVGNASPDEGNKSPSSNKQPQAKAGDQTDDLLNLTEEELRSIKARSKDTDNVAQPKGTAVRGYTAYAGSDGAKETLSANESARAVQAGGKDAAKVAQAEGAARKSDAANAKPPAKAADQTDDLLNPTEEELRGAKGGGKDAGKAAQSKGEAGKTDTANTKPNSAASAEATSKASADAAPRRLADSDTAVAEPQRAEPQRPAPQKTAPVVSIKSDVDPESWAEYGGWYRQDYTIFYRPTGHKDKFIYSWLFLTGPQASKGDTSPTAAVFNYLTSKDAQGSCTKCHSVDDIGRKGRLVNFSPPSVESKQGRFTNFIHEPHFGVLENRGCLTCHNLEKGRPYLKSYEQGNPKNFVSNFGEVKKDLCQTCHTSSMARQDCLLCHKYHVHGVVTPIMSTKLPTE
jgi:hypothetical protein